MFRFSNYGPRLADFVISTKKAGLVTLFACYIWNVTRREYINSRRRDYEHHYKTLHPYRDRFVENQLKDLLNRNFDCPIPTMPRFLRIYRGFSTAFVIYSSIKYTLLCLIYYGWLGIDRSYACYLPGRFGLLIDEGFVFQLPWLALIAFLFHLIWRGMWWCVDRLEINGLLFLLYDRDRIIEKQYGITELNDPEVTSPDSAYRKYLCNKIFYRRQTDSEGRAVYIMKQHRTIEHRERMEILVVKLRLILIYGICAGCILIGLGSFYTYLRHDYFDMSYPSCRSFADSANTGNFEWSFSNNFRLCYLFFDFLDSSMFVLDTTLGLTVPLGLMMVLTHDLRLRFEALRERLHELNERFRLAHCPNSGLTIDLSTTTFTHQTLKFIDSLQDESVQIFNETMSTFKQVGRVDEYVRRLSTFTIFVWLVLNSSYQASLIADLYPKDIIVKVFNASLMMVVYIGLTFSYMMFARPYHRAQLLYKELCIAMALCPPVPEMKMAWRWLLEYYNDTSKYSLHLIGRSYALSNLNTLRCASWFATCTVILFSLLKR